MKPKPLLIGFIHSLAPLALVLLIGLFTSGGKSTGSTSSQSFSQIKAAAERGDAAAQYQLGEAYFYGRGVTKNYTEAEKWYKKAAQQYNSKAK